MSSPRVLILEHSFVRRLSSFLANSHFYSSVFWLNDSVGISLFGVGGRTVDKVIKFDLDIVRTSKPDIVTLELGANDLTSLPPESICSALEELAQLLHCEFNTDFIDTRPSNKNFREHLAIRFRQSYAPYMVL